LVVAANGTAPGARIIRGRPGKSDGMGVFAQEENAIVRLMPHVCQGLLGLCGS